MDHLANVRRMRNHGLTARKVGYFIPRYLKEAVASRLMRPRGSASTGSLLERGTLMRRGRLTDAWRQASLRLRTCFPVTNRAVALAFQMGPCGPCWTPPQSMAFGPNCLRPSRLEGLIDAHGDHYTVDEQHGRVAFHRTAVIEREPT